MKTESKKAERMKATRMTAHWKKANKGRDDRKVEGKHDKAERREKGWNGRG